MWAASFRTLGGEQAWAALAELKAEQLELTGCTHQLPTLYPVSTSLTSRLTTIITRDLCVLG